jgi:hypothetical protein
MAAAFGFFLAASAPHRLHHFFEQVPGAGHQHAEADHNHAHADGEQHSHHDPHEPGRKQQPDCVVLSVAKNAHASLVQSFVMPAATFTMARRSDPLLLVAHRFNPSPFSQRAPPQA